VTQKTSEEENGESGVAAGTGLVSYPPSMPCIVPVIDYGDVLTVGGVLAWEAAVMGKPRPRDAGVLKGKASKISQQI
jgi:hypothetical protein